MGMNLARFYKERLKSSWKLAFFSAFFVGLLVHMFKLVNVIPYWDSLMNYYSSQNMVSSGRWLLSAACSLGSWFDLPWINGLLSLFFIGCTAAVITEHFRMTSPCLIILSGGLLATFPAVTATMAYGYTSDGYMIAMLLAAVAAALSRVEDIRPERWKRLLFSGVCLCLSCGIYQAYISFAFVLSVCHAMLELLEGKCRCRDILRWMGVQLLLYGGALAAYYCIWKLCLHVQGVPATTYQGINGVGSAGLAHMGSAVRKILRDTGIFFFQWNIFEEGLTAYSLLNILFLVFLVVGATLALVKSGAGKELSRLSLLVLLGLSIPFGCFIWHFVSDGVYYHPVMLQSFCGLYIFAAVLYDKWLPGIKADAAMVLLAAVIVSNSISANLFYTQMHLRYERAYAEAVELNTRIHLLDDGTVRYVAFLGEPEKAYTREELRVLGGCWLPAKELTSYHFLQLYTDFELSYYAANGVELPLAENYLEYPVPRDMEFHFPLLPRQELLALEASEEVSSMPVWPAAGSVIRIGDTVVVRFSR